jgi:hypothetical protein
VLRDWNQDPGGGISDEQVDEERDTRGSTGGEEDVVGRRGITVALWGSNISMGLETIAASSRNASTIYKTWMGMVLGIST